MTSSACAWTFGVGLSWLLSAHFAIAQPLRETDLVEKCFVLRVGEWSHAFTSGMPGAHAAPAVIRLDSLPVTFPLPGAMRTLRPQIAAIAASRRPWDPGWRLTSADSVQLSWSTGFVGLQVDLAVRADTLSGWALARHDAVRISPRAPVTGWRVPCPPSLTP